MLCPEQTSFTRSVDPSRHSAPCSACPAADSARSAPSRRPRRRSYRRGLRHRTGTAPSRHPRRRLRSGSEPRSEEHTSELQSLMRISYAVFCLKKKKKTKNTAILIIQRHQNKHETKAT